ncbi:MAG: hypothetical protein ABW046_08440 [Actinoplanes sp.]
MYSYGAFFGTLVVQLPLLAVLILGLVLLSAGGRRLPGRAGLLARCGLGVLLAHSVAATVWSVLLPQLILRSDFHVGAARTFGIASSIVGLLLSALFAAGIGLLIAALLAARRPDPGPYPPGAPQPGHCPPSAYQPVPQQPDPPRPGSDLTG